MQLLLAYLAGVFLGGALLAPWLYWLAQDFTLLLPGVAGQPFHRFVHRSLLLLALLGMLPLLRRLGLRSFAEVGLVRDHRAPSHIASGFLLGVASLGSVAVVIMALGARAVAPELDAVHLGNKVLQATATAATVALLEEVLFRGAFYNALRRTLNPTTALLGSSVVYAIVHFLESAPLVGNVRWWSGIAILPRMLAGFADLDRLVPAFFNLTLAGVLLVVAYRRTGSLWTSIGIHAGWIFCLRMFRALTVDGAATACAWCGSVKLIDGWLALAALTLVLAAVLQRYPRASCDGQWSR